MNAAELRPVWPTCVITDRDDVREALRQMKCRLEQLEKCICLEPHQLTSIDITGNHERRWQEYMEAKVPNPPQTDRPSRMDHPEDCAYRRGYSECDCGLDDGVAP